MKSIITLSFLLFSTLILNAQTWEKLGDIPFTRDHTNGFSYEGKGYVFLGGGGNQETRYSSEMMEYDPVNDTWTSVADFPGADRTIAIGDDWNGKYYYGFGVGRNQRLNDLWEFDPATKEFTELPSCPCIARSHPAFIAHNDKILMGTGTTDDGDIDDWWEYDMITQEWSQKAFLPGGNRHHPFMFALDSTAYVGGGHRTNWWAYDMNEETWTEIDAAPEGRVAGTQFSYNGKGYVLSGDDRFHDALRDGDYFLEYDPETGRWENLLSHPGTNRWAPSSFIIDDNLYFFGGYGFGGDNDATLWMFNLGGEIVSNEEVEIVNDLLQVSPNPFVNQVKMEFKGATPATYNVSIVDLMGKQVFEHTDIRGDRLDLTAINAGVYLMTVRVENTISTHKIVKQ